MTLYYIFPLRGPINGVKVISKYILEQFEKEDFETVVIDVAQADSFSNYGTFNLKKIFFLGKIFKKLKAVKSGDLAYVNFSTMGFSKYRDYLILMFLYFRKIKTTIHIHANGIENVKLPLIKKILSKSTIIIINKDQATKLSQYDNNVYCINNSLPDYYNGKFKIKSIKSFEPTQLIFLSNLSEKKGTPLLFSIAKYLNDKNLKVSLTICGGILDQLSNEILAEMIHKFKFVKFLGPIIDEDEKMALLKSSDFLLFLSDKNYEVFPLVYIEALMNGVAIISTDQIVAENILDNNSGYLISEDTIESVFRKSLNTENLDKLKINARNKFEKDFDFLKFYENIKKTVLNES